MKKKYYRSGKGKEEERRNKKRKKKEDIKEEKREMSRTSTKVTWCFRTLDLQVRGGVLHNSLNLEFKKVEMPVY